MIKRINSKIWLLVILFIFMLNIELVKNQVSAEVYEGTCGKNVTWILDTETGVLTIEGNGDIVGSPWYNNRKNITQVIIKEGATSIGESAFISCTSLESIVIPNSVTSIGESAFISCTSLESIVIPNSVTSIGKEAFYNCRSLESITLPFVGATLNGTSNTHFGYIFGARSESYNDDYVPTSLKEIIITGGTSIHTRSFYECSNIESITISNSVTSIGSSAFSGCRSLTNVYYNGTIEDWCKIKFEDIVSNPMYYAEHIYMLDENNEWYKVTEIEIPDTITSIGEYQFYRFDTITKLTIPNSVTSIGNSAFYNCTSLESIIIPNSVTSIGQFAFSGCTNLKEVIFEENSVLTGIGEDAFSDCTNLKEVIFEENSVLTGIGEDAFYNCKSLESITIPNSVTSIGYSAFSHCSSLTSIEIPNSVTSIGYSAFYNCTSLTSIEIPNSVTSIGYSAFYNCTSLESITLPFVGATLNGTSNTHFGYIFGASSYSYNDNYVPTSLKEVIITGGTSIGEKAFYNCPSLEGITISNSVTRIGKEAFSDCTNLSSIIIPNGVTSIGDYAFYNCVSLTSIELPNSVTRIGKGAFSDCTNLSSIIIPNGVTSIGEVVFYKCTALENITIPNSVTSIGNSAFYNCTSLESIEIPNSVTSIGQFAFSDCTNLKEVIFEENSVLTGIGEDAFYNCKSLESITIPNSVTSIGYSAFYNCSNLESITISNSVTSIGSSAFSHCSSLTSIEIPNSVTSIGYSAFSHCTSLESITLPFVGATLNGTSNTHFGYIFGARSESYNDDYVPTSLKEVIITGGTSIGEKAFYNCPSLEGITISNSVTRIGKEAFSDCTNLTIYCEAESQPSGWNYEWNVSNCPVVWGWKNIEYSEGLEYTLNDEKTGYIVTGIGTCADTNVVVPEKYNNLPVTSIGMYAFENCTSFMSIKIPSSVTSIGKEAFYNCTSLESIVIPNSVTSIGYSAFYNCTSLESITIPYVGNTLNGTSNTHFGYIFGASSYSYNDNFVPTSLKEIIITGGTSIHTRSFYKCSNIESITIPNSITNMGEDAFRYCTNLESIEIPNSVTSIGQFAFSSCANLTIYCAAQSKPSGWDEYWNSSNCPVVWGYKDSAYTSGDLDGDELVNTNDVIYLLMHTYFPDSYPTKQDCDYDNDGIVNTNDVIYLLMHTYFPDSYPIG